MTVNTVDESQRKAARVVGFTYLLAMVAEVFAEFYVRGHLIVPANAAETARNIMAHERLFRLGIASHLLTCVTDVVLLTALYVVLKRVHQNLALAAAFWRLLETTILVVITLNDFDVLRLLSGADYLGVFEADRLQALARLSVGAHGAGYSVALLLFGFGSTVFGYLWLKSNYIPKALAAWGMFASLLFVPCMLAFIIFPELTKVITVVYYGGPIFFFELTMGFWLLLRGLRPSGMAAPDPAQAGAA